MLVVYSINRLAKSGHRESFIELFTVARELKLLDNLKKTQNMVMILHAMSLQEYYDIDLWKNLMTQILMSDDITTQTMANFNDAFHRTLYISMEVFEIDNPEVIEKDK